MSPPDDRFRRVDTPVGPLWLIAPLTDPLRVEFVELHPDTPEGREDHALMPDVAAWLDAALRTRVGPPPLPLPDGPPFRRRCWQACRDIPVGQTRTYGALAAAAGNPAAARAAGSAMRPNPVSLLTPCHRVVSSIDLGGYAGSRSAATPHLRLKRRILEIEGQLARG